MAAGAEDLQRLVTKAYNKCFRKKKGNGKNEKVPVYWWDEEISTQEGAWECTEAERE